MKKINSRQILMLIVSTAFVSGLLYTNSQSGYQFQVAPSAYGKSTNSTISTIQLSAKEIKNGIYNWVGSSSGIPNPTIKVLVNTKNIIKIQNPTDTKHELIIDIGADVLPSSDDINPNGSGQLIFSPNATGTFTYHCAYHPFTMKGTIQIDNVK